MSADWTAWHRLTSHEEPAEEQKESSDVEDNKLHVNYLHGFGNGRPRT